MILFLLALLTTASVRADDSIGVDQVRIGYYRLECEADCGKRAFPRFIHWSAQMIGADDRGDTVVLLHSLQAAKESDFLENRLVPAPGTPVGTRAELRIRGKRVKIAKMPEPDTFILQLRGSARLRATWIGSTARAAAAHEGLNPDKFPSTIYLAHRGSADLRMIQPNALYPGNTIEAMDTALLAGYSGFELDVNLTADRQFIVSHDRHLEVSTDCMGHTEEHTLAELEQCNVIFTGLIPEKKFFHSRASFPAKMPSLVRVFRRFLPDPRLKKLVVDVKPGDVETQAATVECLLRDLPPEQAGKLIFLVRTEAMPALGKRRHRKEPRIAIESDSGWDALDDPNSLQSADDQGAEAVSVSLGLGLGLAGKGLGPKIAALWQVLKAMPATFYASTTGGFTGGNVPFASLGWSNRNLDRFQTFATEARGRGLKLVGWTVNSSRKIRWLRNRAPELDYVLSDLPFHEIAAEELKDLEEIASRPSLGYDFRRN